MQIAPRSNQALARSIGNIAAGVILAAMTLAASGCAPWLHSRIDGWKPPSFRNAAAEDEKPTAAPKETQNSDAPTDEGEPSEDSPSEIDAALATDGFVRRIFGVNDVRDADSFRWTHPTLDAAAENDRIDCAALQALLVGDSLVCRRDPAIPLPRENGRVDAATLRELTTQTNAAIHLARAGMPVDIDILSSAVQREELRVETRCAAAEALGRVTDRDPAPRIRELIAIASRETSHGQETKELRSADGQGRLQEYLRAGGRAVPEVHADLLLALARHVSPLGDDCFRSAAKSPNRLVRQAVAEIWSEFTDRKPEGARLPDEVAMLRYDAENDIRRTVLQLAVDWKRDDALSILRQAIADPSYEVQAAAYLQLGRLGSDEAKSILMRGVQTSSELTRAAAVAGLAAAGENEHVLRAADDKSWRVRQEVARSLAAMESPQSTAAAGVLLEDACPMVQTAAIDATARWSFDRAAPLLFEALRSRCQLARIAATDQLGARWAPAASFPAKGMADVRSAAFESLEERFREEIGFLNDARVRHAAEALEEEAATAPPEIVERVRERIRMLAVGTLPEDVETQYIDDLRGYGVHLLPALDVIAFDEKIPLNDRVFHEVLPRVNPLFDILDRLEMSDRLIRRRASRELVEWSRTNAIPRLGLDRLAKGSLWIDDPILWIDLFTIVEHDPRDEALRIVYAALATKQSDLQIRACEYLTHYPSADHLPYLTPLAESRTTAVAKAAIQAMGATRSLRDLSPFREALTHASEAVRVEAAAVLAIHDDPEGRAALTRLAYSGDEHVRRRAAEAMGEVGDRSYVAPLMHLLDDRQAVRRAALDSLPSVLGQDMAVSADGLELSATERIALWKTWYARTGGTL